MLRLIKLHCPEEIAAELDGQGGIGFLFHATDWDTLEFAFEQVGPRTPELEEDLWRFGPFIGSPIFFGNKVVGANIISPVAAELWMGRPSTTRRFRETQYLPSVKLARRCGLKMLALGALTPYACNYGRTKNEHDSPSVTTGHAATAAMMFKLLGHVCDKFALNYQSSKIAIFGAGGMLGGVMASLLAAFPPAELLLIDLPSSARHLENRFTNLIASSSCKVSLHAFQDSKSLPQFDGALLVSNAKFPYLDAECLKRAKFWIDDTHPRAASVEAERQTRGLTLYIECFARGPAGLNTVFPFRLPTGQDCYACFAEGWVAWKNGHVGDFVTGVPTTEMVLELGDLLQNYGFTIGPLTGKDGTALTTWFDINHI